MSQSVCPSLKGPKLQDGRSNILEATTLQNKLILTLDANKVIGCMHT
jgi:hypothetical protein